MRTLIVLLSVVALAGCGDKITGTTVQTVPTNGDHGEAVQRLFTIDGCTVYRFYDAGYPRYFAKCAGGQVSSMECHGEPRGKITVTVCSDSVFLAAETKA